MQLAVVMGQREIDRFDALAILVGAGDAVEAADAMRGDGAEFLLERLDEGRDQVQVERVGSLDECR